MRSISRLLLSFTAVLLLIRPTTASTETAALSSLPTFTSSFIMGESALVDKETGRIFWEGGVSSTLTAKLRSSLHHHFKATFLSLILLVAAVRALAARSQGTTFALVLQWTILQLPRFDSWFLWTVVVLYLVESYFCSTRRYLTNCMASSDELEAYLEQLRQVSPRVEWKVRSFHYEVISPALAAFVGNWQNVTTSPMEMEENKTMVKVEETATHAQAELPSWLKQKKVTNYAVGMYQFQDCVDKTLAGVWKRARGYYHDTSLAAPMSKITLSKLLVLADSKTRSDYFQQQAAFVAEHCKTDSMAEFSTNIVIPGFKPRLLAIRHRPEESLRAKIAFRFMSLPWFWCFTFLGLTVPYRFWFDGHCDELRVSVVKEISVEPRKSVSTNKTSTWFWSRDVPGSDADKDESNKFRMLMEELKLYGSQPMSSSLTREEQDAELRNDEIQDVIESVESAALMAEQESAQDSE